MNHPTGARRFGPLTTTSVGSFPRPTWLAHTQRNQLTFQLAGETLTEAMDDATVVVLRDQEDLGLDLVTDGEQRRTHFIFHIAGNWNGVDTQTLGHKDRYRNRTVDRMVPRIIGKITRRAPATVDDMRFAKAHTDRPLKMQVPGPMTVVDSTLNEFYERRSRAGPRHRRRPQRRAARDRRPAGCDVMQIDEPAMTRYHDKVRAYGARRSTAASTASRCRPSCISATAIPAASALQHRVSNTAICCRI